MNTLSLTQKVRRKMSNFRKSANFPRDVFLFIDRGRDKWPDRRDRKKVVLVGLLRSRPATFCYSYLTNYLADCLGARIESYDFADRIDPVTLTMYESFGARFSLGKEQADVFEKEAAEEAERVLADVSANHELLRARFDDLLVGDLIYNSYLRFFNTPTLDLADPRLKDVVSQAFRIYRASSNYLARNDVAALFTDDRSYIGIGILSRLAFMARIPVYLSIFGDPHWILQIDPDFNDVGHRMPPAANFPYYRYPEMFAALAPEKKAEGLIKGRQLLEKRLSGVFDPSVRMPESTYSAAESRVLDEGTEPRILVMLHDFIDSPHCYRSMMFADFVEWASFVFERAQKTRFRWYVKPHPFSAYSSRKAIDSANARIIDELKKSYPGITFLPSDTSNAQILRDGIASMFTVYGTAGHEFAYRGVPVVNCGDNPHIGYDFNLHAGSREELEQFILKAGHLHMTIDRAKIEEFVYMHYMHLQERDGLQTNPLPACALASPNWEQILDAPGGMAKMMAGMSPAREEALRKNVFARFGKAGCEITTASK